MKRLFSCLAVLFVTCFFLTEAVEAAVTLSSAELASALGKAVLMDSEGKELTAEVNGADLTLKSGDDEVEASSVVYIEFSEGDESEALTAINKGDFDDFTGLKTLYLDKCTELTAIDLSGNTTIQVLNVSNLSKVKTINASGMDKLRDVHIATLEVEASNSMAGMMGGSSEPSSCTLDSDVLSALTSFDLSENPGLNSVGCLLLKEASSMMGMGGGDPSKYGDKAHAVLTSLKKGSEYLRSEASYAIEEDDSSGFSFGTTNNDDTLGIYSVEDVNLLPALATLNLKDSGLGASDYIKEIDIDLLTALTSADLSGMTRLSSVSLPSGTTLTALDLTNDTALESLNLTNTRGFVFPTGFKTLTGLLRFYMSDREEVDSIDVTPFTKLAELNLAGDALTSLDISKNTGLKILRVGNNGLTSLNISKNKGLEALFMENNMVRELDVSSHTKITSLDITNNSLVKIDLSKNTNIRAYAEPSENAAIRLSPQNREMATDMSKTFNFRELYPQLTPVERGSIVWDSIEGNGLKTTSVDVRKGTATFSYYPALITYSYKSGINYENTSTPLCMNVRLTWDKTDSEIDALYENEPESENTRSTMVGSSGGGCDVGAGALSVITLVGGLLLIKRRAI
ncbi:MAG: hypothetical protein IJP91_08065 [Synergistaceae bacterium]|nr:hypothetical protein [Synergistaceae bacterium]